MGKKKDKSSVDPASIPPVQHNLRELEPYKSDVDGWFHYVSDIALGEKYRDERSGIEGYATAITFMETSCEIVSLQFQHPKDNMPVTRNFEAQNLIHVQTGVHAEPSVKPGSPAMLEDTSREVPDTSRV